jgi:hypothetical protein
LPIGLRVIPDEVNGGFRIRNPVHDTYVGSAPKFTKVLVPMLPAQAAPSPSNLPVSTPNIPMIQKDAYL